METDSAEAPDDPVQRLQVGCCIRQIMSGALALLVQGLVRLPALLQDHLLSKLQDPRPLQDTFIEGLDGVAPNLVRKDEVQCASAVPSLLPENCRAHSVMQASAGHCCMHAAAVSKLSACSI